LGWPVGKGKSFEKQWITNFTQEWDTELLKEKLLKGPENTESDNWYNQYWRPDLRSSKIFVPTRGGQGSPLGQSTNGRGEHPNFNSPDSTLTHSQFGQIITSGDPRILQVALKYFF